MSKLLELREKRAAAVARIKQMTDRAIAEGRDFTAEEKAGWKAVNDEYNGLGTQIENEKRLEHLAKLDREQTRPAGDPDVGRDDYTGKKGRKSRENVQHTEEQRKLCFRAWCKKRISKPLSKSEVAACRAMHFDPRVEELYIPSPNHQWRREVKSRLVNAHHERRHEAIARELRANMSTQVPTAGGYLVPPASLVTTLEVNLLAFGGVRQIATEMGTESGEPLLWPVADDTANQGVQLGENTQAMSAGVNPTLNQKRWDAYKFSSTPVLIPSELFDDSAFDVEEMIGEMLGVRLGRVTATKYATGSGASTPEGIVTGAALGVTAASATKIAADEILRLVHSIDLAYRTMPGVGFLLHDQVLLHLRQLKDGEGRYLWSPGLNDNVQDRLAGYPVNICLEMASSVASGNKTILFGALGQYKIRRVKGYRLYHLKERFRDLDQDGFVAFIREDGKLLQAGTNPVKYLAQA